MINRVEAHINLAALKHNLQRVRSLAPKQSIMAMIKANGYGHGMVTVAKTLTDANAFGVANIDEALKLVAANISQPIVLMSGIISAEELKTAAKHRFQVVVHHQSQLDILEQTSLSAPIKVWLKIDTGMHRIGFLPEQVNAAYQRLSACANVQKTIGLMTHFSDADNPAKETTKKQIETFKTLTSDLAGMKSLANSAGILAWSESYGDWVRPGIMLYGVSPLVNTQGKDFDLQPVMTLKSQLIAIKFLHKGDAIGYGGIWTCPEDMLVGVVGIGYGDGYPRHAKNGTPVLINGKICHLIGRVSMDMITIDLRNNPQAKVGDVVTLWGEGLPAENIANCADTIAYELFCRLTSRVKFIV